jgi:hypothetical protein
MSERIILRTGEALVESLDDHLCAESEIVIGELNGPVGYTLAKLIGDQGKGHSRVFAILKRDVQARPATVSYRANETGRKNLALQDAHGSSSSLTGLASRFDRQIACTRATTLLPSSPVTSGSRSWASASVWIWPTFPHPIRAVRTRLMTSPWKVEDKCVSQRVLQRPD